MEHGGIEQTVALFAAICVVSSVCQWLAWRVKLPAIIFLLLTGIIVGPVFQLVSPDDVLGDLLFPFVSLSVAVILFEGSLTLKYRDILDMQKVLRNMLTIGLCVTWAITTLVTRWALGLNWELCFLFGAISVVTGPTVIAPMLRTVRPKASIANILRWEGIVIDPIGASLAVLVYGFIVAGGGHEAIGSTVKTFGMIVSVGFVIGALGGYLFGLALRRHVIPEYLLNLCALALVSGTFALSNLLQAESGLVTVTVLGIWLANMPGVNMEEILDFKESLSVLLISLLFIILASRLDFVEFTQLGWPAVIIFLAIQFLARPLNIMISARGSSLTWPERHLLAWIAPRGIVAAAVAALFAMQLEQAGVEGASSLVPLTFLVIIGTVLLQSATSRPIALWLGVAEPEPRGILFIGANKVAREIAKALLEKDFRVLLADTGWENISKARMAGLPTYYGSFISDHADRHLDLVGIGHMFAMSPLEEHNVNAVLHYRIDLGAEKVFALQIHNEDQVAEKWKVSEKDRGKVLFGSHVTYAALRKILDLGGQIKTTCLSESFTYEQWQQQLQQRQGIALFAIGPKGLLHVFGPQKQFTPQADWQLISLVCAEAVKVKAPNSAPAC